jgi:hypothetical protein
MPESRSSPAGLVEPFPIPQSPQPVGPTSRPMSSSFALLISLLVTALYAVGTILLCRLGFDDFDSFARLVAGVVMILSRLFFARLLLLRIPLVGH